MFGAIASFFHQKRRVVGLSMGINLSKEKILGLRLPTSYISQNPTEVGSFVHLVQPLIDVIQRNKTISDLEFLDNLDFEELGLGIGGKKIWKIWE